MLPAHRCMRARGPFAVPCAPLRTRGKRPCMHAMGTRASAATTCSMLHCQHACITRASSAILCANSALYSIINAIKQERRPRRQNAIKINAIRTCIHNMHTQHACTYRHHGMICAFIHRAGQVHRPRAGAVLGHVRVEPRADHGGACPCDLGCRSRRIREADLGW